MPKRLSRRERQVMRGIAGGQTSKEIAALLDIAPSTVDWHAANALAKLQAANRTEGVVIALQHGELGRGPWAISRAAGWVSGPWRAVAAAIVLALVPVALASDEGPPGKEEAPSEPVPATAPARPTTTFTVPLDGSAAPIVTAPAPTPTAVVTASPPIAPVISAPPVATLAPLSSPPPALPPLSTALPSLSPPALSAAPLPTVTLLPTVAPPPIPLPTVAPPGLPTIQPAPSIPPSLP
jgi:DNA-binding CsgD family transcriptional regulator